MSIKFSYKTGGRKAAYLFVSGAKGFLRFQEEGGKLLPPLSASGKKDFLAAYDKAVEEWSEANQGNKFFQTTPFALRNTWQSDFYHGLESFFRLQKMANEENIEIVFDSPEWFLFARKFFNVETAFCDVLRARISFLSFPFYRLFMVYQGMRFLLSRISGEKNLPPENTEIILATVRTKSGEDPYWGDLPKALAQKKAAILYHFEGKEDRGGGDIPSFDLTQTIYFKDIFYIFFRLLFFCVRPVSNVAYPALAVKRDIAHSLRSQLVLALLSYCSTKRVLRHCPKTQILSLYENNCWELGVLLAAGEFTPPRRVSGFQHTAILPSHLKMQKKSENKLLPDQIFTSGKEARRILTEDMGHDSGKIKTACALRQGGMVFQTPDFKAGGTLLVLLQGAPTDVLFMRHLAENIKGMKMNVRQHPAWPVEIGEGFSLSPHQKLSDDLARASVAIYNGTTASFEALAAGVPVIYADMGGALNTDPLFNLKNCGVKREWAVGQDFCALYEEISNLSKSERQEAFSLAQSYVKNYFSSADENALNNLVKQIL